MKRLIPIFALVLAAAGARAALPEPDLIARIHFGGVQQVPADTNLPVFNALGSPEALALRAQTADRLAPWLSGWLQKKLGVAVPDGAAKLRPLLDDLQKSAWLFEARAAASGRPEAAIVIELDAGRAQLWQSNLKPFFPVASFRYHDGWLTFAQDSGAAAFGMGLLGKLFQPASKEWFTADVNWPRLAQWYPKLKELALPETQFSVAAPAATLHVDGKFFYPENLALNLQPWRVPTNTLHQPFVSFTAVRGFSGWLKSQAWALPYEITPGPDQLFIWALPQIPYQTFAAVPVPDAPAALAQAYARLQPAFETKNGPGSFLMPFTLEMTNGEISLYGAPFIAPFLRAVREPAGQFLLAGAFPNTPRSRPLPAELFQRLAEKNLVFYHWEITAERLPTALHLSQLGLMLTGHEQLPDAVALKWILKIAPTLGNSVTEITQTAPDQLTFSRTAPGGLTAVELLALGNWLEAPNFPHCDLKLPPPVRPKRLHPPAPAPAK